MIIPTIFSKNKKEFDYKLKKLIKISKNLQIDFMDGKFVRSKSVKLSDVPDLKKYKNNFEAHLMVVHPEKYLRKLKRKGFRKIIFHYSSIKNKEQIEKISKEIKKLKMIPYLAVNPEVKLEEVLPYINYFSGILFMGVHPGKEHQSFITPVLTKIKYLRKLNKKIKIQIDGGANERTIKLMAKSGVDYINSGSFISNARNPKETYERLNLVFKKAKA